MGLLSSAGVSGAADEYNKAMKNIASGYGTLTQAQYGGMSPYMQAGKGALTAQMQMLANPVNQQTALSMYYASPEYAMQQDAANYATMAAAEATGSTGNTATANTIASQATQLGQNYLNSLNKQRQTQMDTLGDISRQGLTATTTMGNWASRNVGEIAGLAQQAANMSAQAAMAPYTGAQGAFNTGLSLGMNWFGQNRGKK
ncbi:MAG: hypothetical protein LBU96_14585 [Yokenella regensburgei]|jgi:hypothetical protein|nr:hypothetical protein [Yokenella regensburgei]